MEKIIFVCTGNTCRSPMAERICQKLAMERNLNIEIKSRGISVFPLEPAQEYANEALKKYGLNLEGHFSKQFADEDAQNNPLILTMTKQHKLYLLNHYPFLKDNVYGISEYINESGDVIDPYGKSQEAYNACAKQLYSIIKIIVEKL